LIWIHLFLRFHPEKLVSLFHVATWGKFAVAKRARQGSADFWGPDWGACVGVEAGFLDLTGIFTIKEPVISRPAHRESDTRQPFPAAPVFVNCHWSVFHFSKRHGIGNPGAEISESAIDAE